MKNKKMSVLQWSVRFVLVFFSLFLCSCVFSGGTPSGKLSSDLAVKEQFASGAPLPDHTYYIQGAEVEPETIIAVDNAFRLQSKLWKKVEWSEKELSSAVFWMQDSERGFCITDGGYLVSADGKRIGVWFSKRNRTRIELLSSTVVTIYPFEFMPRSPCEREFIRDQL